MYNHILYLLYWFGSSLVLYLGNAVFPADIVLGTHRLTGVEAAIYSGFWMTFFVWMMWDFVITREVKLDNFWGAFFYFWIINTIGVWLVARLPYYTGMGISKYTWAIVLGAGASLVQRVVWMLVVKPKRK